MVFRAYALNCMTTLAASSEEVSGDVSQPNTTCVRACNSTSKGVGGRAMTCRRVCDDASKGVHVTTQHDTCKGMQ